MAFDVDISDLPPELIAQLSKKYRDKPSRERTLMLVMRAAGGSVDIDGALIRVYRSTQEI